MDAPETVTGSRRFRFGLKTLLLSALLVAVWLAAFQYGRRAGLVEGERIGFANGLTAKAYPVTYRVGDLIIHSPEAPEGEFEALMDEIVTTVQPDSWDGSGGPATLAPYPPAGALVVSQTNRGHEELKVFLEQKRLETLRNGTEY